MTKVTKVQFDLERLYWHRGKLRRKKTSPIIRKTLSAAHRMAFRAVMRRECEYCTGGFVELDGWHKTYFTSILALRGCLNRHITGRALSIELPVKK